MASPDDSASPVLVLVEMELPAASLTSRSGRDPVAPVAQAIDDHVPVDLCDGRILVPHLTPGGFDGFADEVVPMLQERGVGRTEHEGETLREHLGPEAAPLVARRSSVATPVCTAGCTGLLEAFLDRHPGGVLAVPVVVPDLVDAAAGAVR